MIANKPASIMKTSAPTVIGIIMGVEEDIGEGPLEGSLAIGDGGLSVEDIGEGPLEGEEGSLGDGGL